MKDRPTRSIPIPTTTTVKNSSSSNLMEKKTVAKILGSEVYVAIDRQSYLNSLKNANSTNIAKQSDIPQSKIFVVDEALMKVLNDCANTSPEKQIASESEAISQNSVEVAEKPGDQNNNAVDGEPLSNIGLYSDLRTKICENLQYLKEKFSHAPVDFVLRFDDEDAKKARKTTPHSITPSHPLTVVNWIKESPIFVADGKSRKRIFFPQRKRNLFCFVCGLSEDADDLVKCSGCSTRFHEKCIQTYSGGGYNIVFMQRNKGTFCPRHHCTACFADFNRNRCFNGSLVHCSQCELAWHEDCIPGGCVVDSKREIICPRHIHFPDSPHHHISHCADCQQRPHANENLVKCTTCFRSLHSKCFSEMNPSIVIEDTEEFRNTVVCSWCSNFDFIRYGEFAMGRYSSQKWYPCRVVSNNKYPKHDSLIGTVGYMVVEWLPFRGKIFYNIISHNRVIPMSADDCFFVTEAKSSGIYEFWKMAQDWTKTHQPIDRALKNDQIDRMTSNGEKVREIKTNRYTSADLRPIKERIESADFCKCDAKEFDRCGPSSNCINRALKLECPKDCGVPGKGCNNRHISEGRNCATVNIKYFHGKGHGATTTYAIQKGGFVGEYVGEIISMEEKKRRIERIVSMKSNEAQYYIMDLDHYRAIDSQFYGNNMRFVNHSCSPNCAVQVITSDFDIHLVLVAIRNIKKGEELSFDYNMYSSGRSVPHSDNCTGVLSATHKISNPILNDFSSSSDDDEPEQSGSTKGTKTIRRSSTVKSKSKNDGVTVTVKRKSAMDTPSGEPKRARLPRKVAK